MVLGLGAERNNQLVAVLRRRYHRILVTQAEIYTFNKLDLVYI
jgi:hypothetical protein